MWLGSSPRKQYEIICQWLYLAVAADGQIKFSYHSIVDIPLLKVVSLFMIPDIQVIVLKIKNDSAIHEEG